MEDQPQQPVNPQTEVAPEFQPTGQDSPSTPKIGLVLSGGGVRASVHIGFYEVLYENNIPISYISGTSMGAIIGASIAIGMTPKKLRDTMMAWKNVDFFGLKYFNYFNESLIKSNSIIDQLKKTYGEMRFEDTSIPFACTAVSLESRRLVIFKEGPLVQAVAASAAFPVIFPPVFYKDLYLVDGGLLNNVPNMACKDLGAEKLITVSIKNNRVRQYISGQVFLKHYKQSPKLNYSWIKNKLMSFTRKKNDLKLMVDILLECISIASECSEIQDRNKANPDIYIEQVVDIDLFDFSRVDEAIDIGRKLGEKHLPEIKKLLGRTDS